MLIEQVKKLTSIERLLYWIQERESIRLKREAGEVRPWTDDEVILTYRFCNVRRMDDAVSRWLMDNWYQPYRNHKNMVVACCLARLFNLPSTLACIGFPEKWNPSLMKRRLEKLKLSGVNIFNSAYIVGTNGVTMDKIDCVIDVFVQPLVNAPIEVDGTSMKEAWLLIKGCRGYGSFTAGQVVCDLRHGMSGTWVDRDTWAPAGPGSIRGLNRLHRRDLNDRYCLNQDVFSEQLSAMMVECQKHLPKSITSRLEAMDYQNCLCEFDKYERTLFEGRRPKRLFRS